MSLAKPRGLLTHGFELLADDGTVLAELEGSFWTEGGRVVVGAETWELHRSGWSSSFRLVRDGVDEASSAHQGWFSSALDVQHPGGTYELVRQSMWRRAYDVREAGVVIGSVEPTSAWTNAAEVTLPDDVPLQLQVFVVAVVAIQWRRQQSSSAAAST